MMKNIYGTLCKALLKSASQNKNEHQIRLKRRNKREMGHHRDKKTPQD